ncbi:hypothetical protein BX600DRAFT_294339 [Xylariales sp. PMI_506]|nr:hypothetical protein BX600DRAFT_294339 [Xylariales sp. PMI_506]
MTLTSYALAVGAVFLRFSAAVFVAAGSSCETQCGNVLSSTSQADVDCEESSFTNSAGVVWENCLNCESTSTYYTTTKNSTITDLQAMLYNMRYATSYCLFEGGLGSNPCMTNTACGPLQSAIEYDSLATGQSSYGYCSLWISSQVPKCEACLQAMTNGHYLTNYINILDGACVMQPSAGSTLALVGSIFSTTAVTNVTTPTPTATFTTPSNKVGPLTIGGLVGVVIGGVAALLGCAGFWVVMSGKRKRKAYLRNREERMKNWPSPAVGGEMFETPISQRPLRGWDESPISVTTDRTYPRYFSPYSSQYNSPVSAVDGPGKVAWPKEQPMNIGMALSPDSENNPHWGDHKGKDKVDNPEPEIDHESYEMQEGINSAGGYGEYVPRVQQQAPILGHPGYGRSERSSSEHQVSDLSDGEDQKRRRGF